MLFVIALDSNQCFRPSGRLADHLVFDLLREKLNSKPCRNHGFVLDGYPTTYEQARLMFLGTFQ